jgi:hypothetical protein
MTCDFFEQILKWFLAVLDWILKNPQAVTWLLIVIGWLLVNRQNNLRESRKEARSLADASKKMTSEIKLSAITYLTSKKDELAPDIKSSLELLEIELERFPEFSVGSRLMDKYSQFAESITGGDFESKTRTTKSLESKEVLYVNRSRNELLSEIEKQFKLHFC